MPDEGIRLRELGARRSATMPYLPNRAILGRLFRAALGLSLIAAAGMLLHNRFFATEAREGVLDGAHVTLRSPIHGVLDSLAPISPGTVVTTGALLGTVRNPRHDDTRLRDLARTRHDIEVDAAVLDRRLLQVRRELAAAEASAAAFAVARTEMLAARLQEADSAFAAARARQVEALAALSRTQRLAATGTVAIAALEAARRISDVAQAEARASADRRELAAIEHRAVLAGIFASDTANDRSASQLVQERLRIQEAELSAWRDALLLRAATLSAQIEEEALHFARLREAVLEAPTHSRLIRRLAQPGEYVELGQRLLLLADCSQPEAVAAVSARVLRQLRQGQLAVFYPADGGEARPGTVIELRAEPASADGRGGRLEVVVALRARPGEDACDSGRLGRITFG